jgi:hypothetical protein
MKKKGNELLYGSFFVLKLSIVTFRPQAPHKTARSHLPHDRTTNSEYLLSYSFISVVVCVNGLDRKGEGYCSV